MGQVQLKTGAIEGLRDVESAAVLEAAGYSASGRRSRKTPAGLRVLVIVPAYNEARRIAAVLRDLREEAAWADVVVIDDGSEDGTATVARRSGAKVVSLPFNLGLGGALQTGYVYALERGYDVAVQFDGDGQHRAREIAALVGEVSLGRADVVVGSRLLGRRSYRFSATRWIGSRLLVGLIRILTGQKMTDPTSGFRATSRRAMRFLAGYCPQGYLGDTEATVMAGWHGMVVREVPARMSMSRRSSIGNLAGLLHMLRLCLALVINRIEKRLDVPDEPDPNASEKDQTRCRT